MRIAVLHPSYDESNAPFKDLDPACVPDHYLAGHDYTNVAVRKSTAVRQVLEIARGGFDAVINLCDGAYDEDRPGIEVVQALERENVPFTGAGSAFFDPSRTAMKMACHAAGVGFPAYAVVRHHDHIDQAFDDLSPPLIAKHPHGYSSVGLTPDSRVDSRAALRRECTRLIAAYGSALIEEFVDGREFTVLVSEPRHAQEAAWAMAPIEFVFPPGETFKHFDLKWRDYATMQTRAVDEPALADALMQASVGAFAALGGSGYARCDFRVDRDGRPLLLELNPNCGVFYPPGQYGGADLILANDPGGHAGFLTHLLICAIARRDRQVRPWQIRFTKTRGFGMFATTAFAEGEVIARYESMPQVLVSGAHARRSWTGLRRDWFEAYAWPIGPDVHVTWSENPEEWRPINHSCDPSAWLSGLDLVARRPIRAGDEVTLEYATFCGPDMAPFACVCGAGVCRGRITGADFLRSEIRQRYAGHASPFVQAAWHASVEARL